MGQHQISVEVTLTEINCGECGGTYAINERYRAKKYEDGGSWTCPYCQVGWGYSDNCENAKLKRQLVAEKKRTEWAQHDAAQQREEAGAQRRRASAQKGVATRLKRRAKAGVCPCCNRTFKALASHMKNKHPEFEAED